MTIVERLKAFFLRKRRWRWVAIGIALVAIGHFIEANRIEPQSVAEHGARLTDRLHARLAAVQPQAIADLYARAGDGRHGLGWCGPTAAVAPLALGPRPVARGSLLPPSIALPSPGRADPAPLALTPHQRDVIERSLTLKPGETRPSFAPPGTGARPTLLDPQTATRLDDVLKLAPSTRLAGPPLPPPSPPPPYLDCDRGWFGMADRAALTLRVTPEVGLAVWKDGGWSTTILLALTLALMAGALVALWSQGEDVGCAAVPITLGLLAAGPLLAGGMFWLMLQLLLALTLLVGKVLAGLALVLAWLAAVAKLVMMGVEVLKSGDEAQENFETLRATLGAEPPTGAVPPPSRAD